MDLIETAQGEVRHPWETTRYRFFNRLLRETRDLRSARVLDIGSGDAWFATRLARESSPKELVCLDANYTAADIAQLTARHPGITFSAGPVEGRYDVLLLLDVVEHVEDDVGFLRKLIEHSLTESGVVVFSVPAWPQLWGSHDVALRHYRRYTPNQARKLLEGAGLRILREGGAYTSLQLPRGLSVLRERLFPRTDPPRATAAWKAPPLVTRAVEWFLEADLALCRMASAQGVALPGLSVWSICERRR